MDIRILVKMSTSPAHRFVITLTNCRRIQKYCGIINANYIHCNFQRRRSATNINLFFRFEKLFLIKINDFQFALHVLKAPQMNNIGFVDNDFHIIFDESKNIPNIFHFPIEYAK